MNSVLEYKELARKAAGRAGPGYLKVFLIYAAILAVLNLVIYQLQSPIYDWLNTANQYLAAGNFELPAFTRRLGGCLGFMLLLSFLGKTLTSGWLFVSLKASRGEAYTWHDLSARFNVFWKVFVIAFLYELGCTLASYLLVFPGILLFYNWRLSFFVLAEHPEYGPIQCMKQSRKLMKGGTNAVVQAGSEHDLPLRPRPSRQCCYRRHSLPLEDALSGPALQRVL